MTPARMKILMITLKKTGKVRYDFTRLSWPLTFLGGLVNLLAVEKVLIIIVTIVGFIDFISVSSLAGLPLKYKLKCVSSSLG